MVHTVSGSIPATPFQRAYAALPEQRSRAARQIDTMSENLRKNQAAEDLILGEIQSLTASMERVALSASRQRDMHDDLLQRITQLSASLGQMDGSGRERRIGSGRGEAPARPRSFSEPSSPVTPSTLPSTPPSTPPSTVRSAPPSDPARRP